MQRDNDELVSRFRHELERYRRQWPDEGDIVAAFDELLGDREDPFVRARLGGHFTGASWLVDREGNRVLLTHHRKLARWLQLGGHADGDRDLGNVALREAEEESGLDGLTLEPFGPDLTLFDLDRHWIPERHDVPGHWHYDARYLVRAGAGEDFIVSEESLDLAWRPIADIAADPDADESLRRMARKWLQRG